MSSRHEDGRPPGAGPPPFDPEREAALLSAYVDGELDPDQVHRVEEHLARSPGSRREVQRLRRLQEVTDSLRLKPAPPEEWERFWANVYNRAERSLGWFVFMLGAVLVGGYGLYELVRVVAGDPALPWFLKVGLCALGGGGLLLLVSVLRERIFTRHRTRYRHVKR